MRRACRVFFGTEKGLFHVSEAILKIHIDLLNPIDRNLVLLIDRNETLALSV